MALLGLADVERRLAAAPVPPSGEVIYEWPRATFAPPKLAWQSQAEERHRQLDADGGQRIRPTEGFGQAICISNSADLWNHHVGSSIMRILFKGPDGWGCLTS